MATATPTATHATSRSRPRTTTTDSFSRRRDTLPLPRRRRCQTARQHDVEQPHGAGLVQRLVAVAALGRLDAGRAAARALAGGDRLPGRPQPVGAADPALLGEARAARVPVVHEDRALPG